MDGFLYIYCPTSVLKYNNNKKVHDKMFKLYPEVKVLVYLIQMLFNTK